MEDLRARFAAGKYRETIFDLEDFLTERAGSRYADEAIFLLGRAYYEEGNFIEAEDRFRRILRDYPDSPFAAESSYHLALALLSQSRGPQLDQTETLAALTQFQSFTSRYPKHDLAERARGHIASIRAKLAEKAYLSAELYRRLNFHRSARYYYEDRVLKEYPDTPQAPKALLGLAESCRKTGEWDLVATWASRLLKDFPETPPADRARELLREAARHGVTSAGEGGAPDAGMRPAQK